MSSRHVDEEQCYLHYVGTVFLWIFWPSFNGGGADGDEQQRALINTYLSLAACTVITFAISQLVDNKGKFNMVGSFLSIFSTLTLIDVSFADNASSFFYFFTFPPPQIIPHIPNTRFVVLTLTNTFTAPSTYFPNVYTHNPSRNHNC